ncbi:hypothetical protein NX059_012403 [Plenodomus lindquistii]|nr:hypothetical protein NX059_012403 [Plenodomus lindquistii]
MPPMAVAYYDPALPGEHPPEKMESLRPSQRSIVYHALKRLGVREASNKMSFSTLALIYRLKYTGHLPRGRAWDAHRYRTYDAMSLAQLQEACSDRGLPATGNQRLLKFKLGCYDLDLTANPAAPTSIAPGVVDDAPHSADFAIPTPPPSECASPKPPPSGVSDPTPPLSVLTDTCPSFIQICENIPLPNVLTEVAPPLYLSAQKTASPAIINGQQKPPSVMARVIWIRQKVKLVCGKNIVSVAYLFVMTTALLVLVLAIACIGANDRLHQDCKYIQALCCSTMDWFFGSSKGDAGWVVSSPGTNYFPH